MESSIHGHLDSFHLWPVWIVLVWIWVHKYVFQSLLSKLLGIHPDVELTYHMLISHLSFCYSVFHSGCTSSLYFLYSRKMEVFESTLFCISIHPLMDFWMVSTFWVIVNNVAMNICVPVLVWIPVFSSLRYISRIGVVEINGNYIFIFLRKCHTIVHIVCTVFHFHKQTIKVPISQHCC